jgi:hypothetical protein
MSLADSLNNFRAGIIQTNTFISIAYEQDANSNYLYDDIKKEFIITSAFLRMFIYWESFIEDAFSKYLIGKSSTLGTMVECYMTPDDQGHALKLLIGTQKHVDWANHEIVRKLAQLYLKEGNPIVSNINSISGELTDLKTIRNAAAHMSSTTQKQVDALASRISGKNVVNTSVAHLVMNLHPKDKSKTVLQFYQNILDIVAENIAANRI